MSVTLLQVPLFQGGLDFFSAILSVALCNPKNVRTFASPSDKNGHRAIGNLTTRNDMMSQADKVMFQWVGMCVCIPAQFF